jgi:hypothetical protein
MAPLPEDPGSRVISPVLATQAWLPRARVCAKPGLEEELDWADRW